VGTPVTQPRDRRRLERDLASRRRTPAHRSAWNALCSLKPRTAFHEWKLDRANYVRQGQAIIEHDVRRHFGGALDRAAAAARSRLLVVVSPTDEEVEPQPAVEFARLARGRVFELDGRCGHQAPVCERDALCRTLTHFLADAEASVPDRPFGR
jgi:homoserine acetyltransferase